MSLFELLSPKIEQSSQLEFKRSTLQENFSRAKIFAVAIIFIDLMMASINIVCYLLQLSRIFHFKAYIVLYLIMIIFNVLMFVIIKKAGSLSDAPEKKLDQLNRILLFYITFLLCWGTVITLMDQKLYVQLTAFIINMIACSTLYYIDTRRFLAPFFISFVLLLVGLPFFQPSFNILVGHYVNLIIFTLISFLVSRVFYFYHCQNFNNKALLHIAHEEHRRLSFTDELTGLANRRSYTQYLEKHYMGSLKPGNKVSVIMVDIDYFKQYNDFYGHMDGDEILIKVADEIAAVTKNTDTFAARIGGEEFVLISNKNTAAEMKEVAELLRLKISGRQIPHICTERGYLTISAGIAEFELKTEEDIYLCIRQADKALYFAKKSGRNCIKIYDDSMAEVEC